jgi:probable HAF family extracellular repeat protein
MRSYQFRGLVSFLGLFLWLGVSAVEAATMYTIEHVQVPGDIGFNPFRVNDLGQVVGTFINGAGRLDTFIWSSGTFTTIPTLSPFGINGTGINNSGSVVGAYYTTSNTFGYAPFVSNGLTTSALGTLGGSKGTASAINDAGMITGGSDLSGDSTYHATIWQGSQVLDLGTLQNGDVSFGVNINASGQVAGFSTISTANEWHAFFWNGSQMIDLGTLGGQDSYALGLNANGYVVGHSLTADPNLGSIAFLWDGTLMQSLGHLGGRSSRASAINSAGIVVGSSVLASGSESSAFVWDSGTMRALNAAVLGGAGWQLQAASDINDRGQIVGTGLFNGQNAAFLLTPVAEVPEPNEFLMLGLALGAIAGFRRFVS